MVTRNNVGVVCKKCSRYSHTACLQLLPADLKAIQKGTQRWTCNECKTELEHQESVSGTTGQKKTTKTKDKISMKSMNETFNANRSSSSEGGSDQLLMLRKAVDEVKHHLTTIHKQQTEFQTSMDFFSDKVDEMKNITDVLATHDKRITKNESELDKLNANVDQIQCQLQANDIVINGVPFQQDEQLEKTVLIISGKLDVEMSATEILSTFRLKKNTTNSFVVTLSTRQKKDALIKSARAKRGLTTEDIGLSADTKTKIFINEHLTAIGRKLFFKAKQFKIENKFKYVWTKDNKIFLKFSDDSKVIRVMPDTDFSKIAITE